MPETNGKYKTGVIAGAFDVIHPGYIYAFREAKQYCERLIILLHVDPSLNNPAKTKPVLTVQERTDILMSIRYVDDVVFYRTEPDRLRLIQLVNPDVRFLGSDYKEPRETAPEIPVIYLDRSHGWSATKFKKMICKPLADKQKSHFILTEENWIGITGSSVRCWRCGDYDILNKDKLCNKCFEIEKEYQ